MPDNSRTALILILHGSPREEANAPAIRLASQLEKSGRYGKVKVAYMECNEPAICQAIEECAHEEITRVIALPWFLHAGRHLVLDVPSLLADAAARNPNLEITITDPIGSSPRLSEALAFRAREASEGAD